MVPKEKSTAQALYIARRIQGLAERTGENIIIVFLDWEKAFDKVGQKTLLEALERLNVPEKMRNNIGALYRNPCFKVEKGEEFSEWKNRSSVSYKAAL